MNITKMGTAKLGDVKDMQSLYNLTASNKSTKEEFNKAINAIHRNELMTTKAYDLGNFMQDIGSPAVEEVDDTTKPYVYSIAGSEITHTVITNYECERADQPGANNEIFTIYTRDDLFDRGHQISGPDETHFMNIEDKLGYDPAFGFGYRVSVWGNLPYIDPSVLTPDNEWVPFGAASTSEFSFEGPGTRFGAMQQRVAYWNSIRMQDKIGGEIANLPVNVYQIKDDNVVKGTKIFTLALEESLRAQYYRLKANMAKHGKLNEYARTTEPNSGNLKREANGIVAQLGEYNTMVTNELNLKAIVDRIESARQLTGADAPADAHYLIKAAPQAYTILTTQALEMYGGDAGRRELGKTEQIGGGSVTSFIYPNGMKISIAYDNSEASSPVDRARRYKGNPANLYNCTVLNIGKTKSRGGEQELGTLYRASKTANDAMFVSNGIRGPLFGVKKDKSSYFEASHLEDSYTFGLKSDFQVIVKDLGGFRVKVG